jgi:hypothetical protein
MAKFIHTGHIELFDRLCESVGVDPSYTRRLILDLEVGSPGRVYFETFADDESLKVELPSGLIIKDTP